MANDMEDILRRVAAGELSPEAALPLIDTVHRTAAGEAGSAGNEGRPGARAATGGDTAGSGAGSGTDAEPAGNGKAPPARRKTGPSDDRIPARGAFPRAPSTRDTYKSLNARH